MICSNEDDLRKEYQHIASTLSANGYPQNILTKKHRNTDNPTAQEKPTGSAIIPYAPGISEKLRRIGNKYCIRTAFRSSTTLRSILTKTRPPNQTQESKNCIYNIPCESGKRYIRETCRPLQTRVKEHKQNITNGEIDKSKIAEHSWGQKHRFQWDKASIISKEGNSRIRKLKESAFIHCTDHVISQPSIDMSPIWLPLIRPEIKRKKL